MNTARMSKSIASEMRYFNRPYALSVLTLVTAVIALTTVMFTVFEFFSTQDEFNRKLLLLSCVMLAVVLAVLIVYNLYRSFRASTFAAVMAVTGTLYVVLAVSGIILATTVWAEQLDQQIENGRALFLGNVLQWVWLPALALILFYLIMLYIPPRTIIPRGGHLILLNVLIPVIIPFVVLVFTRSKEIPLLEWGSGAIVLYSAGMLCYAARFFLKAIYMIQLNRAPRREAASEEVYYAGKKPSLLSRLRRSTAEPDTEKPAKPVIETVEIADEPFAADADRKKYDKKETAEAETPAAEPTEEPAETEVVPETPETPAAELEPDPEIAAEVEKETDVETETESGEESEPEVAPEPETESEPEEKTESESEEDKEPGAIQRVAAAATGAAAAALRWMKAIGKTKPRRAADTDSAEADKTEPPTEEPLPAEPARPTSKKATTEAAAVPDPAEPAFTAIAPETPAPTASDEPTAPKKEKSFFRKLTAVFEPEPAEESDAAEPPTEEPPRTTSKKATPEAAAVTEPAEIEPAAVAAETPEPAEIEPAAVAPETPEPAASEEQPEPVKKPFRSAKASDDDAAVTVESVELPAQKKEKSLFKRLTAVFEPKPAEEPDAAEPPTEEPLPTEPARPTSKKAAAKVAAVPEPAAVAPETTEPAESEEPSAPTAGEEPPAPVKKPYRSAKATDDETAAATVGSVEPVAAKKPYHAGYTELPPDLPAEKEPRKSLRERLPILEKVSGAVQKTVDQTRKVKQIQPMPETQPGKRTFKKQESAETGSPAVETKPTDAPKPLAETKQAESKPTVKTKPEPVAAPPPEPEVSFPFTTTEPEAPKKPEKPRSAAWESEEPASGNDDTDSYWG